MTTKLLAIDLGSSHVHAAVSDLNGTQIGSAEYPLHLTADSEGSDLAWTIDPAILIKTVASTAASALKNALASSNEIASIGITGQRQGVAFLGQLKQDLLLSPNIDIRAAFEGLVLQEKFGTETKRITGHFPLVILAPSRLMWLRNHRPDLYSQLSSILTLPAWLVHKLTGVLFDEHTLSAATGLLDISTLERPFSLIDNMGIPRSILPPLISSGEIGGQLTNEAAKFLNLRPGTPITLAGADTQCGMLGMGLSSVGELGVVTGWSCSAQVITGTPKYDSESDAWIGCFPLANRWVLEANLGDAGRAHRWLKDLFLNQDSSWQEADRLASESKDSELQGTWTFLGPGPISAPAAGLHRGGLLFSTPLSYQVPDVGQLFQSFWENLCFSLKANLSLICSEAPTLHLGGGMARSRQLAQTLSNVLNTEVKRSKFPHVSAAGACLAAGAAVGLVDSLHDAIQTYQPSWEQFQPESNAVMKLEDRFEEWITLYQRLQD
ncbi:hypothetical protein FIM12_01550 [SAR202 cluster bacterium AD-804-J14_MRT_500m]|nr:hypothetical protein [SAR202 cluster bacterium AD-804-J14_MRT_500m]